MGNSCWDWRPSQAAWFESLHDRIMRWKPTPGLVVDAGRVRDCLHGAADERASWLLHPCINRLTLPIPERTVQRDFLLCVWTAANSSLQGYATLEQPAWAWSPSGGWSVRPGIQDLAELGHEVAEDKALGPIAVDPWGDSLGVWLTAPSNGVSGVDNPPLRDPADLQTEIVGIYRSVHLLGQASAKCLEWMTSVTRTVVILPSLPNRIVNWSREDVPGAVFTTAPPGLLETIETLVHESAHQHFFKFEAIESLVDSAHQTMYPSPLRKDPRPLRGIFLAFHALAYMLAVYETLGDAFESVAATETDRYHEMKTHLLQADAVLQNASDHLTELGLEVAQRTRQVTHAAI